MSFYLVSALGTLAVAALIFIVATKIGNLYPLNRNASLASVTLFGIGAALAAVGLFGAAAWLLFALLSVNSVGNPQSRSF